MLAKILFLAFLATASCQERYKLRAGIQREPAREYRPRYEQEYRPIRVQEEQVSAEQEEQYKPISESQVQGHAISTQSIVHHPSLSGQKVSQESSSENIAPVYQYVQEEENLLSQSVPAKLFQSLRYTAPVKSEQKQPQQVRYTAPVQKIQEEAIQALKAQAQYSQAQEELNYHGSHITAAPGYNQAEAAQAYAHAYEAHDDEPVDYYAYPKYQYEYKVEDPHTGDNKFQHEYRDGDVVKGVYGLHEADGSIRTVEYSSDDKHGFSAIVKHSAPGQHVQIETHHQN